MLSFKLFEPYSNKIIHGVTEAKEGSFNDEREGFEEALTDLTEEEKMARPVYAKQIHTDVILDIQETPAARPEADAFITRTPGLPLMVKVADCQGLLAYDPETDTIAAIHSGWRGSAVNIIGKTLEKMCREYECRPSAIRIAVSPSLGPCCSEFSDPETELPAFCHPYIQGKKVDFWSLTVEQCRQAGILEDHLEMARACTRCTTDYFSHRRGDSGRSAVFIALK